MVRFTTRLSSISLWRLNGALPVRGRCRSGERGGSGSSAAAAAAGGRGGEARRTDGNCDGGASAGAGAAAGASSSSSVSGGELCKTGVGGGDTWVGGGCL